MSNLTQCATSLPLSVNVYTSGGCQRGNGLKRKHSTVLLVVKYATVAGFY